MAKNTEWFSVDRAGLAKQLADVPAWRLVAELIQNAWDERSTICNVHIVPLGHGITQVIVDDDNPTGFADLTHAWTLFAPSMKADKAEQRGRFNMGEKMLLALARTAMIESTTGTVIFDATGRTISRRKLAAGSRITVDLKLTKDQAGDIVGDLQRLVPAIPTFVCGIQLPAAEVVGTFQAILPTVTTDAEGRFVRTQRRTDVRIYQVTDERPAAIYEMGIPVVAIDLPWSVDVQQKVPLNRDRDNVTPAYLQELRVHVLNHMATVMKQDQFSQDWARAAAGDQNADPAAVERSLDARFGTKRVAFDPSDLEGNRLATAKGYTVVSGGSLSAGEWKNARATTLPAGQVTPSPKPYHPDGEPLKLFSDPTAAMLRVAQLAKVLARRIGIGGITVTFVDDPDWGFNATFGESRNLVLNVGSLGQNWFTLAMNRVPILDLLIHELGHHDGANHMEERYWKNLTRIGAQVADLALTDPDLFADRSGDLGGAR
jgi:hypothetical protein